jgi:Plavaka transposase
LPPDDVAIANEITSHNDPPPWPFANMSIFRLVQWMNSGGNQKSADEVNHLVNDVICAPDFDPTHLEGFSALQEKRRLDEAEANSGGPAGMPFSKDGWQELHVNLEIPTGLKNAEPVPFSVHGLFRQSLIEVIKAAFSDEAAAKFHLTPFKHFWQSVTGREVRVYDEVYTSDAWLVAHEKLQRQPAEPGCKLEKVIAGLMFWSDSTHLTNFGTAKVWPLYLYFANLSKYIRAKPTSGVCHHVAYIPLVAIFQSFYTSFHS